MFKNLLLIIMALAFAIPVFAQEKDPRETVEYWKVKEPNTGIASDKKQEAEKYIANCWDKEAEKQSFIYKPNTKEWNICCAIHSVEINIPLMAVKNEMILNYNFWGKGARDNKGKPFKIQPIGE